MEWNGMYRRRLPAIALTDDQVGSDADDVDVLDSAQGEEADGPDDAQPRGQNAHERQQRPGRHHVPPHGR